MDFLNRSSPRLREGGTYSRKEVLAAIGVFPIPRGGNWYTGYNSHAGAHFIFCNVGTAGRTGHDYDNHWEGPTRLRWRGKTQSTESGRQILAMTGNNQPVYLFHRSDNKADFTFAGKVRALDVRPSRPVEVLWEVTPRDVPIAEEVLGTKQFAEGAVRRITVNAYERDRGARDECVRHYGALCAACDFQFEEKYGEIGRAFIHVHHLNKIAGVGEQYFVDPIRDLRPVCPNCHAMLHTEDPPMRIEKLRSIIQAIKRSSST
jgi:5-methylcytosine-specific restriction protein A